MARLHHLGSFLLLLAAAVGTQGAIRSYYIAARDIVWDYAPGGMNLVDPEEQAYADKYLKRSTDRIGHIYKKVAYFQYTDETFTKEIPKPSYLGLTGPVIRGEIGDELLVTFFNNASGTYSVHPHGVFYLKDQEGAIYLDNTSGRYKYDDIVMPGEKITLKWKVTDRDAPGEDDPACIPWAYHSHVETVADTSAGLLGILVTCRKGVLDSNNERTDVDREYPLLLKNWDENLSHMLDENINAFCLDPASCWKLHKEDDTGFRRSNFMYAINGLMYGHLYGLQACVGERVQFYVIGFGNEFDVHSLHFHGQVLKYGHTRGDTVSVYSATFVAAETTPDSAGYWLIADMVANLEKGGMAAFYFTKDCNLTTASNTGTQNHSVIRDYFLAAEEVTWDYGPTKMDGRTGLPLAAPGSPSEKFFEQSSSRIGGVYQKAKFVAYTDINFTDVVAPSPSDYYLGILGPVLRAEVGDTIRVALKNKIQFPVSLLPHGLTYSYMEEATGGSTVPGGAVGPGQTHLYIFHVPEKLLDDIKEPCLNFLYTSAHEHITGLVGPVLICRKGYFSAPQKKTNEFFLLLSTFDENKSLYLDDNIRRYAVSANNGSPSTNMVDKEDEEFQQSNKMFSINGFSFGNLPNLTTCLGEEVTWYVMSLGSERDVHTVTFDGNAFTDRGKHRDGRELVPGSTGVLHMVPDNTGTWEVRSHSNLAIDGGMFGFYTVNACQATPTPPTASSTGKLREFFIAAEEVEWDYAPLERSIITGHDLNDPRLNGNIFIRDDEYFIGDVYKKAVYREYTDATFLSKTPQSKDTLLGPAMRAEVGDTIRVTFKNLASRPYSLHTHGLWTTQQDSGVNYGSSHGVDPGQTHVYTWRIPPRAGPGPNDPSCIPWLYYSGVDPVRDTNSGLVGALIVCRPGTLNANGKRTDIDKEFFILMSVNNENLSWYLDENVKNHAPGRLGTNYREDPDFEESNKMHAINGRIFGNNPELYMTYNSKIAWYMMSVGAEVDLHSIHLHGHTFVHSSEKHRDDVIQVFPGMAESVEMIADNPGTWLLHCHVLDHIAAGMETVYTVLKDGENEPQDGSSPNILVG